MSHISRTRMEALRRFVRERDSEFSADDVQALLGCCRNSALGAMKLLEYSGVALRVSPFNQPAQYRRAEGGPHGLPEAPR